MIMDGRIVKGLENLKFRLSFDAKEAATERDIYGKMFYRLCEKQTSETRNSVS